MMYWLCFSPAPPWQLEDLQPADPTNRPSLTGATSPSAAELLSAQGRTKAIADSQHRTAQRQRDPPRRRRPRSRNRKPEVEDEGRGREICAGCENFER